MLKTISAALLATSVIAAPAFAAEAGKSTTTAPAIKADQSQTKAATTAVKPEAGIKADTKAADVKADAKITGKSNAVNAQTNAAPDGHKTVGQHRHQDKQVSEKQSQKPEVAKPAAATDKRN